MIYTLEALRTRCKRKAGMENSEFIDTDELNEYINESYCDLYEMLAREGSDRYLFTEEITLPQSTFSPATGYPETEANELVVGFPSLTPIFGGLLFLRALDKQYGDEWCELHPFDIRERNHDQPRGPADVGYTLEGILVLAGSASLSGYRKIQILPEEDSVGTYRVKYIPELRTMTDAVNSVDLPNHWVQYIVADVAVKMLMKEESDASQQLVEMARLIERIKETERRPDASFPKRIVDVYRTTPLRRLF